MTSLTGRLIKLNELSGLSWYWVVINHLTVYNSEKYL